METAETLLLPKGTLVHVKAMPFRLVEDAEVLGNKENLDLALSEEGSLTGGQA